VPPRLGAGDPEAQRSHLVVVSPLVAGVRRLTLRGGADQPLLLHPAQRAVERAHVRHGGDAARLRVLDDPVPVALTRRQAEEHVELHWPQRQKPLDRAVTIHSHTSLPGTIGVAHILARRMYTSRQ
jgi:hypothetical protein